MNERIKEEFDAAGISIPYNQLDVHICPEPANKKAGKGDKIKDILKINPCNCTEKVL